VRFLTEQPFPTWYSEEDMKTEILKKMLLEQQERFEQRLELINQDEVWLNETRGFEAEWGTQVFQDELHTMTLVMKDQSKKLLGQTRQTLSRLESGQYGICSKCSGEIEEERLQILPNTTVCRGCK
jgi:RNA polymerase-binding transcription factor DksA